MSTTGGEQMSWLVFYEKPGCIGNRQQKALLASQGVEFVVRDLLSEPWSRDRLRTFFGDLPVAEWFNTSAPAVKSGELNIHDCSDIEALRMMLADPLLIRRPLMQLGEVRQSGFVEGPVLDALGVVLQSNQDLQSCPMDAGQTQCGEST